MQNQQSLLTGSTQAGVGPEAGLLPNWVFCYLCQPTGSKHYARLGDLTRHIKTVHGSHSRFLCHIDRCPRSIPGSGFGRKDKLVDHLESSKPGHNLSHQDAVYQAALHNALHVQAVPQTPTAGALNGAPAYSSGPHGASQEAYAHNAGLDEHPYMSTGYPHVPHHMMYTGAADPASWHDAFGPGNSTMHNGPFEQIQYHGSSMYAATQEIPNQSVVDGNSMNQTMDPSMFYDEYTQETTHPSTFENIFNEDPVDAAPVHGTPYYYANNHGHHHAAWH